MGKRPNHVRVRVDQSDKMEGTIWQQGKKEKRVAEEKKEKKGGERSFRFFLALQGKKKKRGRGGSSSIAFGRKSLFLQTKIGERGVRENVTVKEGFRDLKGKFLVPSLS